MPRPRKTTDKKMLPTSVTLLPTHLTFLHATAEQLARETGDDVSVSAVVRACIRHAHDNPPKTWRID